MERRQCVCCRARFTPSRNPNQRYCANPACQKKRRCKYQKQKLKRDTDYRANQRAVERSWHQRHPDYWREYRKSHPQQVESNREAQASRDKNRRAKGTVLYRVPLLATMYSFNPGNFYLSCGYNDFLSNSQLLATIGRYGQVAAGLLT